MVAKKFILLPIALVCSIFMKSTTAGTCYCDFTPGNSTNAASAATGRLMWIDKTNNTFNGCDLSGQLNSGCTDQNPTDYSFLVVKPADNSTVLDMTQPIDSNMQVNPPGTSPFTAEFSGVTCDTLVGNACVVKLNQAQIGYALIQNA
ncbi:797_t:CDS:1 [Dentiscutata erythropus]|uniref:797_t:CDS:1 n=1 Tax=Dentiscutata erythropus TaxID=1348616 RepID=A0A9N8ZG88_9GLOM|nr:797_t:CDS:1 [Dentiscutata erythropus]